MCDLELRNNIGASVNRIIIIIMINTKIGVLCLLQNRRLTGPECAPKSKTDRAGVEGYLLPSNMHLRRRVNGLSSTDRTYGIQRCARRLLQPCIYIYLPLVRVYIRLAKKESTSCFATKFTGGVDILIFMIHAHEM